MNRLTAEPGCSVPVEEISLIHLCKVVTQAGELKQHYSKSYPPKKSQQILMYLKHMPTPTLILKNCAAIVQ